MLFSWDSVIGQQNLKSVIKLELFKQARKAPRCLDSFDVLCFLRVLRVLRVLHVFRVLRVLHVFRVFRVLCVFMFMFMFMFLFMFMFMLGMSVTY